MTFDEAIGKATALLNRREAGLVRTYGTVGTDAVALAAGWADVARTIDAHERATSKEQTDDHQ